MQCTDEEMICFNSILGGEEPEWIKLPPLPIGKREDYIRGTLGQLKEKKIVTSKDQLTQKGQLVLRMLDEYKKAKIKLLINSLRIAVIEEEIVVLIAEITGGYEIGFERKDNVIETLLATFPYLKIKQEGKIKRESQFMPYEEWEAGIETITEENAIFASRCREKVMTEQKIYYWDGEKAYCYQPAKKTRSRKGSEDIQRELMQMFEGQEEKENGRVVH